MPQRLVIGGVTAQQQAYVYEECVHYFYINHIFLVFIFVRDASIALTCDSCHSEMLLSMTETIILVEEDKISFSGISEKKVP